VGIKEMENANWVTEGNNQDCNYFEILGENTCGVYLEHKSKMKMKDASSSHNSVSSVREVEQSDIPTVANTCMEYLLSPTVPTVPKSATSPKRKSGLKSQHQCREKTDNVESSRVVKATSKKKWKQRKYIPCMSIIPGVPLPVVRTCLKGVREKNFEKYVSEEINMQQVCMLYILATREKERRKAAQKQARKLIMKGIASKTQK
jgi:hypothetical protein